MKKFTLKIIFGDKSSVDIYHNVDYVEFEALDRGTTSDVIEWGIYSNRGEASFFDIDGTVEPLLKQNIDGRTKVEIYLSSETFDRKCATFYVEDYTYERDTQKITMMLHDVLTEWQSVMMDDIFIFERMSALNFAGTIWSAALPKHPFLMDESLAYDSSAITQLNSCYIDCPHLTPNTLWANMDKLCKVSMCRICVNEEGKPRVYYDNVNKTPIVIRPSNIMSIFNEANKAQTKVPLASIDVTQRTKHLDEEVVSRSYHVYDHTINVGSTEISGQIYPIRTVDWFFVGWDKTLNPNMAITQDTTAEGYPRTVSVSFEDNVGSNVHAITGISTYGTLCREPDPDTRWEDVIRPTADDTLSLIFNTAKDTVKASFALPYSYVVGMQVLSTARTTIKGNFYTDEGSTTYTIGRQDSQNPISPTIITSNELMQQKNVYALEVTDLSPPLYTRILREVVSRYENGVDCCEMECTFEDYYREDGNKVIDGSGIVQPIQGFSRYDTVIPYIQKNHQTVPYKTDTNGNPKKFRVIGMKYRYNGVVRQTLCLQESTYYNE